MKQVDIMNDKAILNKKTCCITMLRGLSEFLDKRKGYLEINLKIPFSFI
jgi:hypothetical protein